MIRKKDLQIAVIEDHEPSRKRLETLLKKIGCCNLQFFQSVRICCQQQSACLAFADLIISDVLDDQVNQQLTEYVFYLYLV